MRVSFALASVGCVLALIVLSFGVVPSTPRTGSALYHTTYSSNWAGYVAYSSASSPQPVVTRVAATWTQPSAQPSGSAKYSSFWVGIGGFFRGDGSLIQTGTDADTSNYQTSYYAWYELLPAASVVIPCLTIRPGDHISAYVTQAGTNLWTIDIATDRAGGGGGTCAYTNNPNEFQQTFSYASSMKSADWVVERPSLCFVTCKVTKLANFGTVPFSAATYVANGVTYGISGNGAGTYDVVLMVNSGLKLLCDIQPRSSPGTSFKGIWKASN